jgi:hypothetical protein
LADHILKGTTATLDLNVADVIGDGVITSADLVGLADIILKGE